MTCIYYIVYISHLVYIALMFLIHYIVWTREGHGSFVRPHKMNFGISISEAIERRYGDLSDDVDKDNMYLIGEKNQRTSVDVVGFDKVKNSLK